MSLELIRDLISDGDLTAIGQNHNGETLRDVITIADLDNQN